MNIQRGFTIIESVLVLAITGLVIAVVLVGIGTSLRAERYRDATGQTIDYFQGLYDLTANVSNERPTAESCNGAGGNISSSGGTGRGTGGCLLVGYMVRSTNGATMTKKQVIARTDVSNIDGESQKTELQTLIDSNLVESSTATSYTLDWGVVLQQSGSPAAFSMLVVRTPLTGVTHTYINKSSATASVASLLSTTYTAAVNFCIDPSGIFDAGTQKNGFTIDQNATNSSSIRQLAAGTC